MQTIDQPAYRIDEAERPLWFGETPARLGRRRCAPSTRARRTTPPSMIAAAGLGWSVEQCPLEAVLAIGEDGYPTRARRTCRATSPTSAATRAPCSASSARATSRSRTAPPSPSATTSPTRGARTGSARARRAAARASTR